MKIIYILGILTLTEIIICGKDWGLTGILWVLYGIYKLIKLAKEGKE